MSTPLPFAERVLPAPPQFRSGDLYVGRDAAGEVVGYAATGTGSGYGGPMEVMVGVAPDGHILGVEMVAERESPGFFRLVEGSNLFDQFLRSSVDKSLQLGDDLDTISGATMSSEGVATSVRDAVQLLAADALNTSRPPENIQLQIGTARLSLRSSPPAMRATSCAIRAQSGLCAGARSSLGSGCRNRLPLHAASHYQHGRLRAGRLLA